MFLEGGGFVNTTVPEGGSTATGMNPEGGTAKKMLPSTPPQVNFWNSPKEHHHAGLPETKFGAKY